MLRALELVGFKSFADRTRFDFPSGITVVVGPNGSGKSNIVDGIKWVLGEQKVKSLRGREMADVIFNGSDTRRAVNTAEVTLTLDNPNGLPAVDTPEVHITRRVYRSGEGEYLINRQPCRLRDIRDLLSGTGMGTQAYSVIEQGKVDVLLQASPHERRVIFEEAAGISRFKSKKLEALRRLGRVEQNLLRLSDIVDEVQSRLRSVRTQANKASRYREYTSRLQELRTQVALVDWRRLGDRLADFEAELRILGTHRDEATARSEVLEVRLLETETRIGDLNESIRRSEAHSAANRERIAAAESTIEHERGRSRDLEHQIARYRQQLAKMSARAGGLQKQLLGVARSIQTAEEHHRQLARVFAESERELTDLIERLDQVRGEHEQSRTAYMDKMRAAAALGNRISGLETQVTAALAACERTRQRMAESDEQLSALAAEMEELEFQRRELLQDVERRNQQHGDAEARLARHREQYGRGRDELAQLQQRWTALEERASILEELEKRQEGVSPGVKQVLTLARNATEGPFRQVCGLVADLLRVGIEAASMVEVALGEVAQYVVAAPGEALREYLQERSDTFAGRVGFVWLDGADSSSPEQRRNLEGRPGVLGRADWYVETEPKYLPLARRLLGRTWIVEKLAHALALQESDGGGVNYVTVAGELLAADGTLCVGPRTARAGLISRRSELRALESRRTELDAQIHQSHVALDRLEAEIVQEQERVGALAAQCRKAADALAEQGHKIAAAGERQTQLRRQREVLGAELRAAATQHESTTRALADARAQQQKTEAELADVETRLAQLADQRDRLEAGRQLRDHDATQAKVELAKSEERLRNLRASMHQFEESQRERRRAIAESRQQLGQSVGRAQQSRRKVLQAESEIALLYLHKETFARQTVDLLNQREQLQQDRTRLTAEAQRGRTELRELEETIHAKELEAGEVRHARHALAARLREDYGIELAELEPDASEEEQRRRDQTQEEIDQLREKINRLGNVNLEAVGELEELEARHGTLAGQYKDLADAKASLRRIIDKINVDSRRLFTETLETIRGHFARLFRELFGGGGADILLEEGVDILECGIEIVARPPGKELRSISLLSGGEKTLTCVALLLAVFRSRPSPFCVLDEVDAALDEANIDRFIKVLEAFSGDEGPGMSNPGPAAGHESAATGHETLDRRSPAPVARTQFILVTHSKKTMTCANTIYGVTMQESGVSKQVSVRFEDVSEEGEILIPPGPGESPQPDAPAADDETQAA